MPAVSEIIEKYRVKIGEELDVGPWLEIDQERIDAFARVTGDEQWIHTDPERAAKDSPYGTTIAHGFLTLSLLPYLTGGNRPETFARLFPGMRLRVNYGLNKVRFPAPVLCGSRVRAKTRVTAVEPSGEGVELILTMTVEIEGKPKPACVAEQIFRLYP